MNNFFKFKNLLIRSNNQAGVSLIITFFAMIIIVSIILSITTLLYQEIKMIRNIGNSVIAFYAADSGIEKVLYYDRKVIVEGDRGLCTMIPYNDITNLTACPAEIDEVYGITDNGLFCNSPIKTGVGCDSDCNDCTIIFTTNFSDNEKKYTVTATVMPDPEDETKTILKINSLGAYKNLTRKVELIMEPD